MAQRAITVQDLGKLYKIGQRSPYGRLTEVLTDAVRRNVRRERRSSDHIWAIRNVSLAIDEGEVVGVIGNNGAGKSTLLKLLSRITEPTEGRIQLTGRVGTLLEVGTGFHPELTGRENVVLNGAILGMKAAEIKRKFDEIVAFAEVETFLDTPVKRYSTGMAMRLAFSIAAHLEPEILLVDEVLAVGDATFQEKCLGKMSEVSREGRTVIFVSHNLAAVQRLCQRSYLFANGRIAAQGPSGDVIERYHETVGDRTEFAEIREVPAGEVRFVDWMLSGGVDRHVMVSGKPCTFQATLIARRRIPQASFGLAIWSGSGVLVWAARSVDHGGLPFELAEGEYTLEFAVDGLPLRAGDDYQILVSANDMSEGALDAWYAQPRLSVSSVQLSGLPIEWRGLIDVAAVFHIEPRRGAQ